MPLSEDEQRILHQIEQQFYESDPAFAQSVSQSTLYRHAFRRIKWSALMLVLGLVFLVFTLHIHFALAFVGLPDHAGGRVHHREERPRHGPGRPRADDAQLPCRPPADTFGGAGERMRNRFKREDECTAPGAHRLVALGHRLARDVGTSGGPRAGAAVRRRAERVLD